MKYTRNAAIKLINIGFKSLHSNHDYDRLQKGVIIATVRHFDRTITFDNKPIKAQRLEISEKELKILDKIFNKII